MKWYSTPGILQKAFPSVLWRVPSESNELFLTFDDGPTPEVTTWVLDLLKKHNAKATFFCLGKNVERYPQIFDRILAEGHSIGNHSYDHPRGKDCDNKIYFENIEKAADLVKSKLFRPPYGSLKISQYRKLKKQYKIVMWDLLSYDFDLQVDITQSANQLRKKVEKGSIIVFHDSKKAFPQLKRMLPQLLEDWSKAYTFAALKAG